MGLKKKKRDKESNVKKVICPECGSEIKEGLSFCPECGYDINPEKSKEKEPQNKGVRTCPNCKHVLEEELPYCPECGAKTGISAAENDDLSVLEDLPSEEEAELDTSSIDDLEIELPDIDIGEDGEDEEGSMEIELPDLDDTMGMELPSTDTFDDLDEALNEESDILDDFEGETEELTDDGLKNAKIDDLGLGEGFEEDLEALFGGEETSEGESEPETEPEIESESEEVIETEGEVDGNACPECGTVNDDNAVFCKECGNQLTDVDEIKVTSPLFHTPASLSLIDFVDLNLENALPGDKVIAKRTADGRYEVLVAPMQYPIYVLDCSEKEADVLKADYLLREIDAPLREKVDAYCFLSNYPEILKSLFGIASLDAIYEEDTMQYIRLKDVDDELLDTNIDFEIMHILSELGKPEQRAVARVIKELHITRISKVSAHEIVSATNLTKDKAHEILSRDSRMYEMLCSIIESMKAEGSLF